jgi:predicted permease
MTRAPVHPPLFPRIFLRLSLPEGTLRDSILGDFSEEHSRRARTGSTVRARLWYWRNALGLAVRSFFGRTFSRGPYWVSGVKGEPASVPGRPAAPRHDRGSRGGIGHLLDTLGHDLRFAIRQLSRRPGFSALVVLTLAVGIGGNVAIFSVLKGVVLRELPYPEPERLVAVWETPPEQRWYQPLSGPDYLDIREQTETLEDIGVLANRWFNLSGGGEPVRIRGNRVTASLFSVLGVAPAEGRLFTEEEELEGNERVLILSHGLWQRQFGGEPGVVGRTVNVNGEPHEIIGIMPKEFEFPTPWGGRDNSQIWAPLVLPRDGSGRDSHWLGGIARLADGVEEPAADVELHEISVQLAEAYPDTNAVVDSYAEPMMRRTLGGISSTLVFLLMVVFFVLLIACANVASMLLARGTGRLPELAIRSSMGAGRRRLVRQLLTESLLLSVVGGLAGVFVAYWGVDALRAILPDNVPRVDGIQVDSAVLTFAAVVTVATGVLFGLAPALFTLRSDLVGVLKEGRLGRGGSRRRNRLLGGLVAAQVAIGFVLVNVAVLLWASYSSVMSQDLNFDTDQVVVAGISLSGPAYEEIHQRRVFHETLLERVRGLPGVVQAGITNKLPLQGGTNGGVLVNDDVFDPTKQYQMVEHSFVDDGYHEAMGITLLAGRTLTRADLETGAAARETAQAEDLEALPGELPLVVNRTMAEQMWPDDDPLGKLVRPGGAEEYYRARVVGVVEDTRQWGAEYRALPEMYFPYTAEVWGPIWTNLVVRVDGDPETVVGMIRAVVREIDDQIPMASPHTMGEILHDSTGRRRFSMLLVGLFAATALILIIAGTYGVMSYAVTQRTHEIGVRVALGADRRLVFRHFIVRALWLIGPGLLFGLLGAYAFTAVGGSMVYGISALNPLYVTVAAIVMVVVALAAITLPILRASRVDPVEALRAE